MTDPARVPVNGKDGIVAFAIVDAADLVLVERARWCLDKDGYVCCHIRKDGKDTTAKMHRLIMGARPGFDVDHINGNRLDNRRSNLRVCTHAQNMMNHRGYHPPGRRGIRQMVSGRWQARIQVNKRETSLGSFDTAEDAWSARRAAELKHKGEFAPVEA